MSFVSTTDKPPGGRMSRKGDSSTLTVKVGNRWSLERLTMTLNGEPQLPYEIVDQWTVKIQLPRKNKNLRVRAKEIVESSFCYVEEA